MKVTKAPEFVLMLTEQDVTIPDAVDVYDAVRDAKFGYLAFKDVGADPDALRVLTARARADGRTVLLELADTTAAGQRRGYALARSLGVDAVVGTWDEDVAGDLEGPDSPAYWPFVGTMSGSPLELVSDAAELGELARTIGAHPATAGMVLMPYRQQRVEPAALLESVTGATSCPVLVAGGVSRPEQIADLAGAGAWGFTMGSAVLKDRHEDRGAVARAIDVALGAGLRSGRGPRGMELSCGTCGAGTREGSDGPSEWSCPRCQTPFTVTVPRFASWSEAVTGRPGVARYAELLPVTDARPLESVEEALVPLGAPRLAELLGVAEVHLLPQTLNHTGTFKDNEGVLVAAKCHEWGLREVCMHSSGNTARAYTYYLSALGIPCVGFVPRASAYKCPEISPTGTSVSAVDGGMVEAADAAIAHAEETGAFRLTPSTWKIEGKVPLGLAIAERVPRTNIIAVTAASAYGALGMQRGIERAREAGLDAPSGHHYRIFQAADAAALGEAVSTGANSVDMSAMADPRVAYEPTLQSTNPNRTLPLVRELIEETASRIDPVTRSQVDDAAPAFLAACGELGVPLDPDLEKSALICWGGLVRAAAASEFDPGTVLTMVVSGSAPLAPAQ